MRPSHSEAGNMKPLKTIYRSLLIYAVLLVVPILLMAILFPCLPVIQLPRLGLNGSYVMTLDKYFYYLLVLISCILFNRLRLLIV